MAISTSALKEQAETLGLTLGITACQPPRHFDVFLSWLSDGNQAGMAYLSNERSLQSRSDPGFLLPGCRSLICAAAPYPSPLSLRDEPAPLLHGRVAAYAWQPDYHLTLPGRMDQLAIWLQNAAGREIRRLSATDSQPILERDYAVQAGLGWIGKNSCLILPQRGSFYFLAELLTDLELEPDLPVDTNHCGTCTRCIDACPTGCILPGRKIDARRCLSYLTIENKGRIPPEYRKAIGNRIFGCDVCQTVCPWNKHSSAERLDEEKLSSAYLGLSDILSLTPLTFKSKFTQSPIFRAKRRGLIRNACVALGNAADPHAEMQLQILVENEPEPMIRAHAAWALGQIGGRGNRQFLDKMRNRETDPSVMEEIISALENTAS
jgi:epoxyqueuosine reductase